MGRTTKIIIGALVVVVLVVAVLFGVILSNIGGIIREAVETAGSEVTGTEVELAEVDISMTDGRGTLRGFRVENPDGFERDDAFRFDEVSVKLDISSITSDPVIVDEVIVIGPRIVYELAKDGSNIERIQKNVEGFSNEHGGSSGSGSSRPSSGSGESEGPNIIIRKLILRDGDVSVRASEYTDRKLTVPLPEVTLENVGGESGGASPAEIAEAAMSEITGSVMKSVQGVNFGELLQGAGAEAEALLKDVQGGAGRMAEDAGKAAGDAAKSVTDEASKLGKDAEDAAKDAGDALKSLFK